MLFAREISSYCFYRRKQYTHKELVFGEIKASPHKLPGLREELLGYAKALISNMIADKDSIISIDAVDSNYIEHSFKKKLLIINTSSIQNLSGYTFYGNIIIWSALPLTIEMSTKLEDVILIAPQISIKSGFKGTSRLTQSNLYMLMKTANLVSQVRCAIHSEGKYNPADSLIISIGNNSKLSGAAMIESFGLPAFIKIGKGAQISGQVYLSWSSRT